MAVDKLFSGEAEVVAVDGSELKDYQKKSLNDEQIEQSFLIMIQVQPSDKTMQPVSIEVEISPRECAGKMAGKVQSDVSMQTLLNQKLVSSTDLACLDEVFPKYDDAGNMTSKGAIGKTVQIYQKASTSNGKDYVNTYFSSGFRMSSKQISARLALLRGGAKKPAANPFD